MKLTIAFLTFFLMLNMTTFGQDSFYDFEVTTIEGEPFKLAELKGKKVMVVNVASKCGLTPQYDQLQKVYDMYGGEDFTIIGFPANNFLSQEPGSNEEIQGFCKKNYGVTFLMMSKISVKGDDIHPLYEWLTSGSLNNFGDSKVKWNFQKYLINRNGEIEKVIPPKTLPDDKEVIDWIIN